MADKNPFIRAIREKAAEESDAQDNVAVRGERTNPRQASRESDGGHAEDTPNAVTDNAEAEEDVGAGFGLGGREFVSAKDRIEVDDSSGDPAPSIDTPPSDRIADGKLPGFNIDGASTQDALNAASGADNTDVGDLATGNPRDFVDSAKAGRNPLNDPQIAASMAFVDEASDSTTDKLSVAAEPGETAAGAGMATAAAGLATAAVGAAAGAGGVAFTGVGIVVASGGIVAGAATTAANEATDGAFGEAVMGNVAAVPVVGPVIRLAADAANAVGEAAVAVSDVAAGAATPSEAATGFVNATSGSASTGAAGSQKGGGAKLVDPDADGPPSEAEMAFVKATKDALGIRRIPGDIDPGDGDGTQSSGPVDAGIAAGIVAGRTNESLVGNPGALGEGQNAPAPSLDQGQPTLGGTRQGGDIDPEEGSSFTGGTRTEGPEDVNFNVGSEPLIGFDSSSDDDDDEDEDEDDEDDDEGDGSGG